jgi:hypothetical protein
MLKRRRTLVARECGARRWLTIGSRMSADRGCWPCWQAQPEMNADTRRSYNSGYDEIAVVRQSLRHELRNFFTTTNDAVASPD